MVSDSWEMAQILQQDAAVCQGQQEIKMEVQMSIFLVPRMIFQPGLIKKQDGSRILIGSH